MRCPTPCRSLGCGVRPDCLRTLCVATNAVVLYRCLPVRLPGFGRSFSFLMAVYRLSSPVDWAQSGMRLEKAKKWCIGKRCAYHSNTSQPLWVCAHECVCLQTDSLSLSLSRSTIYLFSLPARLSIYIFEFNSEFFLFLSELSFRSE